MVDTIDKFYIGLIIMIGGFVLLLGGNTFFISLIDNNVYNIELDSNIDSSTSMYNLSFDFDKTFINKYYEVSDGRKVYLNYINIYLNTSANESINYVILNNNKYNDFNTSAFQHSLQLDIDSLNPMNQTLNISKNDVTINKIELSYRGMNYYNYDYYVTLAPLIDILIIVIGIFICI